MRLSTASLMIAFFMLLYGAPVVAKVDTANTFSLNLSIGSIGAHVITLQQILNSSIDTRVNDSGPGSPGNETDYFGPLTKSAVIRFQEKYNSEILAPVGLMRGNGYVGFYTRAKLNALSALKTGPVEVTTTPVSTSATSTSIFPQTPSVPTEISQNPNLKNLDKFLGAIDNVATKQGFSVASIATIKEQVTKATATTTDLRATFLKTVQDKSNQTAQSDSFIRGILTAVEQVFYKIFISEHARAAGGIPFGGSLLYPFYCWDSGTWLITIEPLPPTFVSLLTYVPGSQAYLSYNIPFTTQLLGEYIPGGVCVFACPYCVFIPGEGMITSSTGSSPL